MLWQFGIGNGNHGGNVGLRDATQLDSDMRHVIDRIYNRMPRHVPFTNRGHCVESR